MSAVLGRTTGIERREGGLRTLPGVPRWARWSAHAAALTAVPSGLWRIAWAAGIPVGVSGALKAEARAPGWGSVYMIGLSLFAEALAFLTLGLVQPWGETWPRWIPLLGGRRIPTAAAVVPAALGAVALTLICGYGSTAWYAESTNTDGAPTGAALAVMTAAYAPLLAWGPLLAAVTIHYYRRRTTN